MVIQIMIKLNNENREAAGADSGNNNGFLPASF